MTDKERIIRLEQMVKVLNEKIKDLCRIVNTGSYNYELSDIALELHDVEEFKREG